MKITGTFYTRNDEEIKIIIYNPGNNDPDIDIDESTDVRLGAEPVVIKTDMKDSFEQLIKTSATISLVSKRWLGNYLFADNDQSIIVNVLKGNQVLFCGYVTPNSYNQDYAEDWNELEINCVDYLSILKNKLITDGSDYDTVKGESTQREFAYFIDKFNIADPNQVISNIPEANYTIIWVETGWMKIPQYQSTGVTFEYYARESKLQRYSSRVAVDTGITRLGEQKTPTYIDSSTDTMIDSDGKKYFKSYAWITINGRQVNTGDWIRGQLAPVPTVEEFINILVGFSQGPLPQPYEYYDYYRQDCVMSDGQIKEGTSDAIGDMIPETPDATSEGSYYEWREGSDDDLEIVETSAGAATLVVYYYKDYQWIIQTIDGVVKETNTGSWKRGRRKQMIDPGTGEIHT